MLPPGVAWFRPRHGQFYFLSSPVLSLALLTIIGIPLGMLHERAHWLGARVEGAPARITISRRYYLLVLQTDRPQRTLGPAAAAQAGLTAKSGLIIVVVRPVSV